ncbi:transcriptional regulator BetI [Ruegeria marina]|uniref:Transcriptional regulator, TetR family n=1 Tax=Ruegeria marina TaxID=639004 RepID=A0A1G7CVW0_9RHOB|nr:transcriptional regulator BetI [Ruegeria marina]SDE42756.1 transcriptional regulator, TetR family [Ruegeria marina]
MIQNAPPPRQRKERKDNADRRRKQLIEATLRSVVENGLSRTTLATVANAAGLSQGVAVFYFKSKDMLLAAALEHQYSIYADTWRKAVSEAGTDAPEKLAALIRADFSPLVCNREALAVWFSFWGEASFRPRYAESARDFDLQRGAVLCELCDELLSDAPEGTAQDIAFSIDSLTDGFWQRLYLSPETFSVTDALRLTMAYLRTVFPDHSTAFRD